MKWSIFKKKICFSNIKDNIPLVVISYNQDDAAIPEDIINDSKNYHYSGNIKAWVQSGGKIEYPKNINFQVIFPSFFVSNMGPKFSFLVQFFDIELTSALFKNGHQLHRYYLNIFNFFQALYDSIVNDISTIDISTIPVILIDVRSPIEINTQKSLPTAHNIPISKIEKAFQKSNQDFKIDHGFEKPSKDYPNVILTCRSGRRVKFADVLLKKLGYNKLRIYEGSYLDWTANDGPLVKW